MTQEFIQRFWLHVTVGQPDECWPWKLSRSLFGHGQVAVNGRPRRAHRVAYELAHGSIDPSLHVLHSCDNPSCCNPAHLRQGTDADNMADAILRGRLNPCRGEKSARAKLTTDQVRALRVASGTNVSLGRLFGVAPHTISRVRSGVRWRHLS